MESTREVRRILFVEDNAEIEAVAVRYLARRGLRVDTARGVEDALMRLTSTSYDAVVTDLDLSGSGTTSGLRVIAAAAQALPKPWILLWSGSISHSVDEQARRLGADDVLGKPGLAELAATLTWLLDRPHGV
ncbi:MAG: response regulator [Acidobacteria bacterium]|nr:response regulator [Acidobacteriota bacterium]